MKSSANGPAPQRNHARSRHAVTDDRIARDPQSSGPLTLSPETLAHTREVSPNDVD